MLKPYDQQRISEYTNLYDLIVGKEHLLRKIKDNIDLSFVNPMLKKNYCEHFGRPAKEPEMMFKQEFLKKLYDLSDEALIENIKVDMAYKYFLGMNPEDEPVDPSLLSLIRHTCPFITSNWFAVSINHHTTTYIPHTSISQIKAYRSHAIIFYDVFLFSICVA